MRASGSAMGLFHRLRHLARPCHIPVTPLRIPRRWDANQAPAGIPYSSLSVGLPLELLADERRTALTPANVALLRKRGFREVLIAQGAGARADFTDKMYEAAGARIVSPAEVLSSADILLKVRAPSIEEEVRKIKEGATTISFLYPALKENAALVEELQKRKITSFAMDCIKRISRAQVFDALSSMANVAGYRAVLEASTHFGRFLVGQSTAAGKVPPGKVLVIGAGVAGLSAIATAKRMGAIVRGFDTRPVVREQVQSLGAEFLDISIQEDGSGQGGYAKEMSKEFHQAEHDLFKKQAREVDIIITTALIPGKPAPLLLPRDVVEAMKPGSVIVDLAAETGGNCELTRPGSVHVTENGVTIIGYTDLPSRLPTQSSTLYSNNVTKFLLSMGSGAFDIDLKDEVVRGAIVTHKGEKLYPPPATPLPASGTAPSPAASATQLELPKEVVLTPMQKTTREVTLLTAGMGSAIALGKATSSVFMSSFFTAGLASLIGYRVVHGVVPALHSPLMSVTNAISGLVGVGAVFLLGGGFFPHTVPQLMAALAVAISFGNVAGGFVVTQRMLEMFRRPSDPEDFNYLYALPGVAFTGAFVYAAMSGASGLVQAGYLISSLLCIGSLAGLSSQLTARRGNALGILGVGIGFLSSVVAAGFSSAVLTQFLVLAAAGSAAGAYVGLRISPLELPQTVAALHSVVGLAAVLTSTAAVFGGATHDSLHLVIAYLGVLVGGVTFTGSVVAFGKLSGRMSSRPLVLPQKHLVNGGLLAGNLALMAPFLSYAHSSPLMVSLCLLANTGMSFVKGYTVAAAIGGGDMPVAITVLNAFSGLALVSEGLMLNNNILTTAGTLIVCSGSALTLIMCRAMNRSIVNVLFGGIAPATSASAAKAIEGSVTSTSVDDTIEALVNAESVFICCGYGMAVSKAQYALSEIVKVLKARGIVVRFAVHPVAGRMPGQINVLLAEAGVSYEDVLEMDEANPEMHETDLCLIVGCNDVVNPISQEADSPLAGMPVIEVWKAKQVIVSKRSMASGYADVPNPLFYYPSTKMLFGDAKASCEGILRGLQEKAKE